MAFRGIADFINSLRRENELAEITSPVSASLEITEITDRITKSGGKALLFTNNGTGFPVLMNAYGSVKRLLLALNLSDLEEAGREIEKIFYRLSGDQTSFLKKITMIPQLIRLASIMPACSGSKGECQAVIHKDPDLGILPVLKCWPYDGGKFITLPMVHTVHPVTGKTNVGMYRMQILGKNSTGMHWQRHKTGSNHFEAWKKEGRKMPVSVTLGGDPVYAYSATAPLPENINEYILAGFLRKKKVKLVKCITNDLYVPDDADIVIEGFVDPGEELIWEGPFGDHTGFYSLADWYPEFHVTCITHRKDAIYPATIVGVPPHEDALLAMATEKIFLAPVKITLQPEIEDFHLPVAGVAHNLMIVRINKTYPGQGMKVLSSLFGTGQMMFTKYLIVVSGDVSIRNYRELSRHILLNTDLSRDLLFSRGPLDVLDHSSDAFSYGGKMGLDATVKMPEERKPVTDDVKSDKLNVPDLLMSSGLVFSAFCLADDPEIPVAVVSVDIESDKGIVSKIAAFISASRLYEHIRLFLLVDHLADTSDLFTVAWQVLGNTDPVRDHIITGGSSLIIDGTVKLFGEKDFPRKWPNVVCSDQETISLVDSKWSSYGLGPLIKSPSEVFKKLHRYGREEIMIAKTEKYKSTSD